MVNINNIYTSVGCSRTPGSADWGKNNLIVFGACNSVALLNPNYNDGSSKILKTFSGHTKRVICVKWIKPNEKDSNEYEFLSGSDDGLCIYWNIKNNIKKIELKDHTLGITAIDGIYINNVLQIVTTSTDSTIKIWNRFQLTQTISLKTGFSFAIRLIELPETNKSLLIFSTDDCKIKLYSEDNENKFIYCNELVGHEDWVRGIDAINIESNEILIATSSQDTFIRLWKIKIRDESKEIIKLGKKFTDLEDLEIEETLFSVDSKLFSITLESVLQSHEGWVYGVHLNKNSETGEILLLSSSIDKTLIIWSCDKNEESNEIWNEKVRVGDIGGNSLGFYGGKFSNDSKAILGHGYQGSLHLWRLIDEEKNVWQPGVINGGHFNDVNDLCWEPKGEFLLTTSTDQTTRCHSYWARSNQSEETWHEIARPQIHGYDIQCITSLSRYKFASGADEKIIRTFQAPMNFIENFLKLSNNNSNLDDEGKSVLSSAQKGASVPSLGLSNRAVCNENGPEPNDKESYFTPLTLEKPPFEENLMQNTLWPEVQKLYGHGNELYAVASSQNGLILASACKASTAEHAQIIIWDTKTWKQIQKLSGNSLTITQLKFSPNNKYLLSVSRDRKWCIFENQNEANPINFKLLEISPAKGLVHSRIIWCSDWSHDSKLFATGARDGKLIIWKLKEDNTVESINNLLFKSDSVTAAAFYQDKWQHKVNSYLIAIGLESGDIYLYLFVDNEFQLLHKVENEYSHHLTVTKLQFRPISGRIQLASCGKDHIVRINEIILS